MDQEQSAGEVMVFGLIDQADRLGKSAKLSQQALAEQIEELAQVRELMAETIESVQVAIRNLEAERVRLQSVRPALEQSAAWAMREALREESEKIETHLNAGMATPLRQIQQAAGHVGQNFREAKWLLIVGYVLLGTVLGLLLGYFPMRSSINALEEHVTSIDHYLAALQSAATLPSPAPQPAQKGKAK